MSTFRRSRNPRQVLVQVVQELELREAEKKAASDALRDAFENASAAGFDTHTLKVVLKLRKMTPDQRREKRALEAVYLATLGMLEGEPLTDEARRRLDEQDPPASGKDPAAKPADEKPADQKAGAPQDLKVRPPEQKPKAPAQMPMALKDPEEARKEGKAAAAAGKRVYDNPYPAGDPCRAAWDEGWCAEKKSNGMDTPAAYQRRTKPPEKDDKDAGEEGAA